MNAPEKRSADTTRHSAAAAWLRALELTAPIARCPNRCLPNEVDEIAAQCGQAPALLSDRESLTYGALADRSNRYARWALRQGLAKGDTVGLLMPNRPEYIAIWLGITKVGGVVALLNTRLSGSSLAHSINIVAPKHIIAADELLDQLNTALPQIITELTVWTHGAAGNTFPRIDQDIEHLAGEPLNEVESRQPKLDDRALCVYTSGTTGVPKAANISHGRLMQWSLWFAGMMGAGPTDRMYDCLPLYHSVGGLQAPGAVLVSGGSIVIREEFSARRFWSDIVRWDCSLFQYIGELCRYLLRTNPSPHELEHRLRLVCGNGLRPDIWDEFKNRFHIPKILEFYASTEGVVSLFNAEGETGSIGRIPPYLAHRFPVTLVEFDVEKNQPVRNDLGFCNRCAPDRAGEAIAPLSAKNAGFATRFEGYTTSGVTEQRILRNVFQSGDAWFRTGDLMRKDDRGYFYFVDRTGDTFRWKGENVATFEVAEAISMFPGVDEVNVYGVTIPGTDGKAGMAALVAGANLDLPALRSYLISRLPEYARPIFLRIRSGMEVTGTFKYTKTNLAREGFDPAATADAIYFNHPEHEAFVRLDQTLYDQIQTGQVRVSSSNPTKRAAPESLLTGSTHAV